MDADNDMSKAADRLAAAAEKIADTVDRSNPDLEAFMAAVSEKVQTAAPADMRHNPLLDEMFGVAPKTTPTGGGSAGSPADDPGRTTTKSDADLGQLASVLGALMQRIDAAGVKSDAGVVDLWHPVVDLQKAPAARPPRRVPPPEEPFDPSGAVNAIRGVPNAAANPAGAAMGLGDMLSKALGPEAVIVWETGKALAKLGEVAIDSARAMQQQNFQLAYASSLMAGVQARDEVNQLLRDREVGDRTAGTSQELADSLASFDEGLIDIKVILTDMKNVSLAEIVRLISEVMEPLGEAAKSFNEWRKSREGIRWLGQPPKTQEAGGFGDIVQRAQEDDAAARFRAQQAFQRMQQRNGGR